VSVWKDSRLLAKEAAAAAVQLAAGQNVAGAAPWAGGERKFGLKAKFRTPVAITQANLDQVVTAGWVSKAVVCKGVDPARAPAACK
jgi:D-xylose transport system substrate-binding protein